MTNFCLVCESAVTPTTPSIKCGGFCKKYCHIKCLNIAESEVTAIIANKNTWICEKCSLSDRDHPVSAAVIEAIIAKQLDLLRNQLQQSMDDHFKRLNDRITTVENNVRIIQDEWSEFKNSHNNDLSGYSLNDVVSEIEDRKLRSHNVMLFNIPESSASAIAEKVTEDLNHVMKILAPLGTYPQPSKIIRMGQSKPNVNRPLKIVYDSESSVMEILKSNKLNPNRLHHFRPDLTKMQRDHINGVKKEFSDRIGNGEKDCFKI